MFTKTQEKTALAVSPSLWLFWLCNSSPSGSWVTTFPSIPCSRNAAIAVRTLANYISELATCTLQDGFQRWNRETWANSLIHLRTPQANRPQQNVWLVISFSGLHFWQQEWPRLKILWAEQDACLQYASFRGRLNVKNKGIFSSLTHTIDPWIFF